jgi:hypothetical protein
MNTKCLTISDNWNHLMRLRDMKYIGFKHQRENKQNSDKGYKRYRLGTIIYNAYTKHPSLIT